MQRFARYSQPSRRGDSRIARGGGDEEEKDYSLKATVTEAFPRGEGGAERDG